MATTLQLIRWGQSVGIEPISEQLLEVLARSFYTVRHEYVPDDRHGQRLACSGDPLFDIGDDPAGDKVVSVSRGLVPLVIERLRQSGFRIKECHSPPKPLGSFNVGELRDMFERVDRELLETVRRRDRAVIRYPRGRVQPAKLIAQIAVAWPKKSILILVTRVDEAEKLKRQLGRYLPNVIAYHHMNHPKARGRVVVSTYAHAGGGEGRLTKRHIVIALNAAELLRSTSGRMCVIDAWKARVYGFLPEEVALFHYDRDQVTALFGTEVVAIPEHGRQRRQVTAVFTKIDGGPRIANSAKTLAVKKRGIWNHPVRNRRIAALAKAVGDGNERRLSECFPAVSAEWCPGTKTRIAVLVENLAHALVLSKQLPGWRIVCDSGAWTSGIAPRDRQTLEMSRHTWQRHGRLIVTASGLGKVRSLDVLIRADGGFGLPPLPHRLTTCRDQNHPLLLVDMFDRHHRLLRRWSTNRREAYVEAGWNVAGIETNTALDQFLATRPKVELL
jgi:hypothetical protein